MDFKGKKIVLGITGSIATYKTPMLVREFIKRGAEVKVVATKAAAEFVSFMVLENLTHNFVISDMFDNRMDGEGAWHIEWAHWCDFMLIAPCSATSLSKLATGNCDNPLSCVAIALPKDRPLIIAPAMDFTMFEHPATQNNIAVLEKYGAKFIQPESGELASGLIGSGRLPDFSVILQKSWEYYTLSNELVGKKVLITAGPTIEKIDDVRYISNFSTGKMGYAIAERALHKGASVTLISGPTHIKPPLVEHFVSITSAEEMANAVKECYMEQDIIIMAAAVADYSPSEQFQGKIKKDNAEMTLELTKTEDILKFLGNNKKEEQVLIGFALESQDALENAKKKLVDKKCDFLVLNVANQMDSGFGGDNNTIIVLNKEGEIKNFPMMSKVECAETILSMVV